MRREWKTFMKEIGECIAYLLLGAVLIFFPFFFLATLFGTYLAFGKDTARLLATTRFCAYDDLAYSAQTSISNLYECLTSM
jgi:hypothetical protein